MKALRSLAALLCASVGGASAGVVGGASAGATCGAPYDPAMCYANPSAHFGTAAAPTPASCCDACAANPKCASWTHWKPPAPSLPPASSSSSSFTCYLFSNVGGELEPRTNSCTSGTYARGPTPTRAPTPAPACSGAGCFPPPAHGPVCADCPNIVFSLTDDQDVLLGGWEPMVQTRAALLDGGGDGGGGRGAMLTNWRIHTPICSPSRSETISGRYFHNVKSSLAVPPPTLQPAASGHIDGALYNNQSLGVVLRAARGYNTAIFGKANFNTYEGFDRWFQGASLGVGGKWEDNESPNFHYKAGKDEYATALLGNKTIEWLRRDNVTGASSGGRPFFVYFAPHAPHNPATPAPWYIDANPALCEGVISPRLPNYNHTHPSFHELVAKQPPLTAADAELIDELARRRCQSLLSVDDAHAAIVRALKELGKFDNTYFIVTSDHGYNLGHHRIPSNKFLLYEHAVRIPAVVSGPGIVPGNNSVLGTNVDYAPTFLGMAGIDTPPFMDGRSLLPQLVAAPRSTADAAAAGADADADAAALAALPPSARRHVAAQRKAGRPWARREQFFTYFNQGGPSPFDGKPAVPWNAQGWAPGSASNPGQPAGDLGMARFPAGVGLHATVRPLDDWSNTYIGLFSEDPAIGSGRYKYGEYQYVCNSSAIAAKACFDRPDAYQLFDLVADPYELVNVYDETDESITKPLAARLRDYYGCLGAACP